MKRIAGAFTALDRKRWFARHRRSFVSDAARRPRLFVDVSVIARNDARTGIQRVVRAVWLELSRRQHPAYDFCPVYAGARHGYCHAHWSAKAERPTLTAEVVVAQRGDRFLGLDLAAHLLPRCTEQLAAWRAAGVTTHFVIYDLLPLTEPDWFNPQTSRHFQRWFETIVAQGDDLLCISDAVARQVRKLLGDVGQPAIKRIHLSGELASSRPSTGLTAAVTTALRSLRGQRTVLMVGTLEPRKGYGAALRAMEQLWAGAAAAPNLLIVGKAGWKTAALQRQLRHHPEHGRRLHWLEDASDEALELAYARASMMLLATHSEGFGLPLVEATRHRRWVLARDLPVFREQQLTNVRYFNDDGPETLAGAIRQVLALAAAGPAPAQRLPTWRDCVDRLLGDIGVDGAAEPAPTAATRALAGTR